MERPEAILGNYRQFCNTADADVQLQNMKSHCFKQMECICRLCYGTSNDLCTALHELVVATPNIFRFVESWRTLHDIAYVSIFVSQNCRGYQTCRHTDGQSFQHTPIRIKIHALPHAYGSRECIGDGGSLSVTRGSTVAGRESVISQCNIAQSDSYDITRLS
jgi:hypothetical protein